MRYYFRVRNTNLFLAWNSVAFYHYTQGRDMEACSRGDAESAQAFLVNLHERGILTIREVVTLEFVAY